MLDTSLWVIAYVGSRSFIGKLADEENLTAANSATFYECGGVLVLSHTMTYVCEFMQTPNGIMQQQIATPIGHALSECPMTLKPDAVLFLGELSEADQAGFVKVISQGMGMAKGMREQRSGIVTPPAPAGGLIVPGRA
jgi:hypothetical protein